jgi:hypothetical protein
MSLLKRTNSLNKGVKVINERFQILVYAENTTFIFFLFQLRATQSQPLASRDLVVSANLSENKKISQFLGGFFSKKNFHRWRVKNSSSKNLIKSLSGFRNVQAGCS